MAGERFNREAGKPQLAEAPPGNSPVDTEIDTEIDPAELLMRLERQAAESGRLEARIQALEEALKAERGARRRLADRLKRERDAAAAIHERAERDAAELSSATEELERLRHAIAVDDQQVQMSWARLMEAEQQLAWKERSPWRKLLRRPPAQ